MTDDLERIETYTQGNPRLLELFIGLHRAGEPIEPLLAELSSVPSLEFLLKRMWLRLNEEQRKMLFSLTPFRRPAPRDAWHQTGEQDALAELIERRLVQEPHSGQITLLPAFRGVVYHWLSADDRRTVHLRAGMIRTERAEYTLAADHYLQAGEEETAFRLWHEHQEQEINQGQAGAALTLLEKISIEQLKKKDRERLALSRGNLLKITGQYEASRQTLASMKWETPTLEAEAKRLEGDVAELKGELQEATDVYFAGLHTIEKLLSEKTQFHRDLGWVAKRQKKLDEAWGQAMLADYEATNLKGYVKEDMRHYDEAMAYYEKALALAKQANYEYGRAKTYNNLGRVLYKQGQFEAAEEFLQKAYDSFKRRGQISSVASAKVNQAVHCNFARKHETAITLAQEALEIFERLDEPWGRDVALLNLAEAYLGTHDLENAEVFAQRAIQGEGQPAHEAWWTLGEIRLAQKKYKNSAECLLQALRLAKEHGYSILEGYALRSLAKAHRATGDDEAAQTTFDKAMAWFEELGMQNEVEETRKVRG